MNNRLIEISNNYNSVNDFIIDKEVKSIINDYRSNRFNSSNYKEVITAMVNTLKLSKKDTSLLIDLFSSPSILSISAYKKYLRYKGSFKWNYYRDKNNSLYDDLAIRMCTFLKHDTFEKMIAKYSEEIRNINYITGIFYDDILDLFNRYQEAYFEKDSTRLALIYSEIRDLIQKFNSKSKEKFISDYVDHNLDIIKNNFKCNNEVYSINNMSIDSYLDSCFSNSKYIDNLKLYIKNNFSIDVFDEELKEIMYNILKNKNKDNRELFNIHNYDLDNLIVTKNFNRLCSNYLKDLNELFDVLQVPYINYYIYHKNDSDKRYFSKKQLLFLETIIPIVRDARAHVVVSDDRLNFVSSSNILSIDEENELKRAERLNKSYKSFCNLVFSDYYKESSLKGKYINTSKEESNDNVIFNDSNYYLSNTNYLLNFELIAFILSNIDSSVISKLSLSDKDYLRLKKFLIDDGLLACSLTYMDDGNDISTLINNILNISDVKLSMNSLPTIFKKAELFNYVDDFTLSLLGSDVAYKIVFDVSFLVDGYVPEKIKERLLKANTLMLMSNYIKRSAIPYFDPIKLDGVSIERYNNNDSSILTSGIDSNTCFKLSAVDNDYMFYSVLNKNGMVAKIMENGEMIGRITAHRNGNCLLINSIRSNDNRYQANCFEDLVRNDKIIKLVKKFADTMIKLTTDSDLSIDYVVCNKAGILSSFEYDKLFPTVPECFFKNPIDTYNKDFIDFKDLFSDTNFLQQIPFNDSMSEAPFSTDYGNYPIVLISSRSGKMMERRFDISMSSADDIYERTNRVVTGKGKIPDDVISRLERIDAIDYFNKGLELSCYSRVDYTLLDTVYYEVSDNYYVLIDTNDNVISKSIDGCSDIKKLIYQ
ncbi:MAG: hypothetical protein E7160_03280 [Firmicutes bacterium]|nr:hypothetical protein [Bacillota bacterium]